MKFKKFSKNFTLIASLITLFSISYKFNQFLDTLEEDEKLNDNLDLVVMIGVGFSILPLKFLFGNKVWRTTLLLFACSSIPVIVGYRKRMQPHFYLADLLHSQVRQQIND